MNIPIVNLPRTQILQNDDLMIVQTENGTQTITFENLNIVKTDLQKNASIAGNLNVDNTIYANTLYVNQLCANEVIHEAFARIIDLRKAFTLNANVSSVTVVFSNFYNRYKIEYKNLSPTLFTVCVEQPLQMTPYISRGGITYNDAGDLSVIVMLSGYPTTKQSMAEIRFLYFY